MLLEETIKEVSNRYSPKVYSPKTPSPGTSSPFNPLQAFAKSLFYAAEIKKAINDTSGDDDSTEIDSKKPKDSPKAQLKDQLEDQLNNLKEAYALLEGQNSPPIDYQKLFSYLEHKINPKETYEAQEETPAKDTSWLMSDEEAKEAVQKIQLSYLTGGESHASWKEKERFTHWQEFNKALLFLYDSLSLAHSNNTNYSKMKH